MRGGNGSALLELMSVQLHIEREINFFELSVAFLPVHWKATGRILGNFYQIFPA